MRLTTSIPVLLLLAGACGDDDEVPAADTGALGSTSVAGSGSSTAPGTDDGADTSAGTTASVDGSTGEPPSGCAASPEALSDCVDLDAYTEDLEFIAELRVPGTPHWQAVQDLCADRLTELGFEVDLFEYGSGVNVIGTRPGASDDAPHVLIGAHYDHIPGCTGADDNATGVAASLEAARVLVQGSYQNTLTIACWDEEEVGLVGSEAFAQAARDQGIEIVAYYNFEMVGYASDEPDSQSIPAGFELVFPAQIGAISDNDFRGDFLLVAADDLALDAVVSMTTHADRLGLPLITVTLTASQKSSDLFGDLRRSDHAPFWDRDYPALFISDTGEFRNQRYHCMQGEDSVDALVPSFTDLVMRATVGAAAESLVLE